MKKKNLHVVVSVESFAANGARELGGADEDLGRCRDPILGLCDLITRVSDGGRSGGWADMESHGDSILAIRVLQVLVVRREAAVVLLRVALPRRPQREQGGAVIIFFVCFKIVETLTGRHVWEGMSLHGGKLHFFYYVV